MTKGQLQHVTQNYKTQLANREASASDALIAAYQRALDVLQPQLDALYQQIADKLANGDSIPLSWLYEDQRLEMLKQFISDQMNQYGHTSLLVTNQLQHQGVLLGNQSAQALLQAMLPPQTNYVFAPPSQAAIAALIGATRKGSPLADLFSGFGSEAAQNAGQALINGVSLGMSAQQVARDIRQALDIERARALTIARTELLRAYRGSSLENYRANDDVCGQWRWSASKSGRTCAACLAMDGTLHDLSEEMDSHPNCRCSPIPVPLDIRFQSPYQSGEDWLQNQDESVQQQVLGNKFDGWTNGDFSLSDIVGRSHDPQWGGSIYVKSLKQLS